jgi:N-acetylglucosaminyl-diphospho-decaprenol L-rhamnosyltransferase
MTRRMDLSIIIVNWNSREYLKKCLMTILTEVTDIDFEIVVIDSGSFDGCGAMLADHFPNVRFVQSTTNLGFAEANNRACLESRGDCVLFLNPDTEVVGSAIPTLYANLNALPRCGIVGARLLNSDGSLQFSCIQAMPTILNKLLDSEFLRAKWPRSALWGTAALYEATPEPREVEAISGACMMIKRSTFEQVGRYSEDYFMYAEDVDLSHKVRAAGFRNYYVPGATVIHHGGTSSQQAASSFAAVMTREATWRFLRKTRGTAYGVGYRTAMFASAIGRLVVLTLSMPFRISAGGDGVWKNSFRKWVAVLQWTVDRDDVVHRYYPPNRAAQS